MNKARTTTGNDAPLWRRLVPLVVLLGLVALVFFQGWHRYLSLEQIAMHRDELQGFVAHNFMLALVFFMVIYIAIVALSLPGGALLTITGGFLFGWMLNALAVVIAATLGAVIIFIIARTALGSSLAGRAGPWLEKLRHGFNENALSYLLFLRLVPAFPFWLVNLAPALLGVPLRIYAFATFIGIIPGTMAFSFLGAGLDSIIKAQKEAYEACLARAAAGELPAGGNCNFTLDAGALLTNELLLAFAALGFIAILPVLIRKFRGRREQNER